MRRVLTTILILCGLATTARAQDLSASPMHATTAHVPDAIAAMQSGLRNLVTLQEKYWMQHGSYTTDMSSLGIYSPGAAMPKDSVWVQVIFAGSRGWTGMATRRGMKANCVVFIGSADELPKLPQTKVEKKLPASEGTPTCDAEAP